MKTKTKKIYFTDDFSAENVEKLQSEGWILRNASAVKESDFIETADEYGGKVPEHYKAKADTITVNINTEVAPELQQAIDDATQTAETLARQFSEAFGLEISQTATPHIFYLLSLINSDCGYATQTAKHHYMRKRPFVQFHETTSIPAKEPHYRNTGSYPSGHSATGWGIALVLSEINPARQEEILKRGYEIGESRVIAGFHYQSDVDNARLAGSAAVARLHADKSFMKQLQKAKDEFTRLSK